MVEFFNNYSMFFACLMRIYLEYAMNLHLLGECTSNSSAGSAEMLFLVCNSSCRICVLEQES